MVTTTTTTMETPIPSKMVPNTRVFRSRSTSLKRRNNDGNNECPASHKKSDNKTTPPGMGKAHLNNITKTAHSKATQPANKS